MFWGGVSGIEITYLLPIDGLMNSEKYIENILEKEVQPLVERNRQLIFQQDNAACHTAHKVTEYFRANNIEKIDWPSHSPDLNIIENIWNLMKAKLNKLVINDRKSLIINAKKVWKEIVTKEMIVKYADTMPDRIAGVIKNRGNPTKY